MKTKRPHRSFPAGISLIETIVSVGVLAIAVPLVLGAMVKAGGSGRSSRAETRAPAIADHCLVELRAAREGRSAFFDPVTPGEDFPAGGKLMGLAFGREGGVIGKVDAASFDSGLTELNGEAVYYLAKISGEVVDHGEVALVTVAATVEYPAVQAEKNRSRVTFYTKLP